MGDEKVNKEITQDVIATFLNGRDPQERIINLEYSYKDDFIQVYYRNENDDKCIKNEPFFPFLWATYDACDKLCNGNRAETANLLRKYNIEVKRLRTEDNDGFECEEMKNGYKFLFRAISPMSYGKFLEFFKMAKNPVYSNKKNENNDSFTNVGRSYKDSRQYITCTPQEQYLIYTGKRFFKGYDDYDQVLRMIFDLETTGLDTKKDKIVQIGISFNRPVKKPRSNEYVEFKKIFTVTGNTEEERNASELECIIKMFSVIYTYRPDIITAHNGENFDWNMIINACERLGTSIDEVSSKYFGGKSIHKNERESILKLGGEIEKFNQTIVPGVIVTDSLHAVRRAQATNSNFLKADLKYATNFLNLKKDNRVYTPGSEISTIWEDLEEHYAFNDKNGDWYLYDKNAPNQVIYQPEHDLSYFQKEYEAELALNSNNDTSDKELYNEYINYIKNELSTRKFSSKNHCEHINPELLDEDEIDLFIDNITEEDISNFQKEYSFETWRKDNINDEDYKIKTGEERYNEYLNEISEKNRIKLGKEGDKPFVMYKRNFIMDGYTLVSGRYIIERYLFDDLYECDRVEKALNGADFMLCKFIPVTFQKCCTMGTASQWKLIMMAWSYENDLAIPMAQNTGSFTGGLSRLLSVGYQEDVAKFDYNSLYPSIILTWAISDKTDLMGAMLHMLEYVLTTREKYKGLKKKADNICEGFKKRIANGEILTENEEKEYSEAYKQYQIYDNLQMVVKKLGNSFFGSYGSNNGAIFPWKSISCAERTTCTGRQSLRLMISYFNNLGYKPIVGDTDGFDFGLPKKDYRIDPAINKFNILSEVNDETETSGDCFLCVKMPDGSTSEMTIDEMAARSQSEDFEVLLDSGWESVKNISFDAV